MEVECPVRFCFAGDRDDAEGIAATKLFGGILNHDERLLLCVGADALADVQNEDILARGGDLAAAQQRLSSGWRFDLDPL